MNRLKVFRKGLQFDWAEDTDPRRKTIRITIHDIWPEANTSATGLGKIRVFARPHTSSFDSRAYAIYDTRDGMAVQSATVETINLENEVRGGALQVGREGKLLMTLPLEPIPGRSTSWQNIWIPAPLETQALEFRIMDERSTFKSEPEADRPRLSFKKAKHKCRNSRSKSSLGTS